MKGIKGTRWWEMRDLWPDYIRRATLCRVLGHRYTLPKMYDVLCCRCRAATPRRYPVSYTDPATGRLHCVECNISLSSVRHHARSCTLRHLL